jgi:hypothetical protein
MRSEIWMGMTDELRKRIKLFPVSTSSIQLIENYFQEFRKEEIFEQIPFDLKNQKPPDSHMERNDDFIDRIFSLDNKRFECTIEPGETNTWRFGFTFSASHQFPPDAQGRHENDKDYAYVHLCIGDYRKKDDSWVFFSAQYP